MTRGHCVDCRHFMAWNEDIPNRKGMCVRFPPQVNLDQAFVVKSHFPMVDDNDSCGELEEVLGGR